MMISHAHVSTEDQKLDLQWRGPAGDRLERVFEDTVDGPGERPALRAALA